MYWMVPPGMPPAPVEPEPEQSAIVPATNSFKLDQFLSLKVQTQLNAAANSHIARVDQVPNQKDKLEEINPPVVTEPIASAPTNPFQLNQFLSLKVQEQLEAADNNEYVDNENDEPDDANDPKNTDMQTFVFWMRPNVNKCVHCI